MPMWPSQSPSGMAIAHAIAIETPDSWRCGHISSQISPRPPTCEPPAGDSRSLKMKSIASKKSFIAPPSLSSRA